MKQSLLKIMALLALVVTGNIVLAQETSVTRPVADTWVRANSPTSKGGSSKQLEVKTYTDAADASKSNYFYALLTFEFTSPATGNEVKSATLRLTTRYKKGDSEIQLFPVDCIVDEGATDYHTVGNAIERAKSAMPISSVKLKGDGSKAPTDVIAEDFQTVSAWQNTIDISSYVRSLTTNKFTLLIVKPYDQNNSSQIYAREATDETLKNGTVFAADDLVPQLTVDYQEVQGQRAVSKTSVADVWVSSKNPDNKYNGNTVEMQTNGETLYYGLMSFTFDAASEDEEIQKAELRLVTRYKKGDSQMLVYAFNGDVEEGVTTYNLASDAISQALASAPIATFAMKGCAQWAPTDKSVTEEYATVEAWTNRIDVTDYVKSLTGTAFSILLQKPYEQGNSSQIWSKEAADVSNHAESSLSYTFKAEDLVPQLTVTYQKRESTTIAIQDVSPSRAPQGTFTLSGQRVSQPSRGIYIVNGRKVVVR
jgi:hypothetical protein